MTTISHIYDAVNSINNGRRTGQSTNESNYNKTSRMAIVWSIRM